MNAQADITGPKGIEFELFLDSYKGVVRSPDQIANMNGVSGRIYTQIAGSLV